MYVHCNAASSIPPAAIIYWPVSIILFNNLVLGAGDESNINPINTGEIERNRNIQKKRNANLVQIYI